ncbi:MAG: aspartate-semialdehyde dehydrogenase [Candidatus Tectimicrobiota bacterium]|nr:MAG: aspartate-semialdehyde dehydrogenase [Candidatus Tectomicrobia bacterium]
MRHCHVAVIGATGAVGQEILQLLEERDFPLTRLTLLASGRSAGTRLEFRHQSHMVHVLTAEALQAVDLAFFAANAEASQAFAPLVAEGGGVAIDCSGAFRCDPAVPLCLPAINAAVLPRRGGIVALPHSITTQVALVLAPLHAVVPLRRVLVTTYQSVSGLGRRAVQAFDQQVRDLLNFRPVQPRFLPVQMAFNCIPQCGAFTDTGYTEDEMAVMQELPRLLAAPDLAVAATAVLVPLAHSHAAVVSAELAAPLAVDTARQQLQQAPGVVVEDDWQRQRYPSTLRANGQDAVFVGRLRADPTSPNRLHLWVVADNLRRGAALGAVQVAERLLAGQG